MSSRRRYFDCAATTPLDPLVRQAMEPWLGEQFGNAHSIHQFGGRARAAVESARQAVAELVGAESPEQIFFTSGATESNNWVAAQPGSLAISPFEHAAMRSPALARGATVLANDGWDVLLPVAPMERTAIMGVQHETGTKFPVPSSTGRSNPELTSTSIHRDATQELGKTAVRVAEAGCDSVSFSAHKLYGPQGVGALYVRRPYEWQPWIRGGEQEHGMRAGTLNVAGIVGFGVACQLALERFESDHQRVSELSHELEQGMTKIRGVRRIGGFERSPYIHGYLVDGVLGESVVVAMDSEGFAISSGAACSSMANEPSPALVAAGTDATAIPSFVRISLGRDHQVEDVAALVSCFARIVHQLRGK